MGDYGGNDRGMPLKSGIFQWPLLAGALLVIAAIYGLFPTSGSGPNSVSVVGITAPRPAYGSYPGLRVPVTRPPQSIAQYPT